MRICTITCQNADNYGARLQAYALAEYLKLHGHEIEVIDYRPSYLDFKTRQWYFPKCSIKEWIKLFLQVGQRKRAIKRHEVFEAFSARHIPLTNIIYKDIRQLRKNPPQADAYIAGSDQIWNTTFPNGKDASFFLDFGSKDIRRISYAASFATKDLVKGTEPFVREGLLRFDNISVREQSGLRILQSLGSQGHVVVDPVFLLPKEHWDKILMERVYGEPYILLYDFLRSAQLKSIAKRVAKKHHCKIYSVGPYPLHYADRVFLQASPEDFISLIKQARCVISNSFHGTVFSIIYHRDFFVVEREDGLNDRMQDLLCQCGIQGKIVNQKTVDSQLNNEIDYNEVDRRIEKLIKESKDFLRDSLA